MPAPPRHSLDCGLHTRVRDDSAIRRQASERRPRPEDPHLRAPSHRQRGDVAETLGEAPRLRRQASARRTHIAQAREPELSHEQPESRRFAFRRANRTRRVHRGQRTSNESVTPLRERGLPTLAPLLPVAIIGAGLSGLYAAHCLKAAGAPFTIFEVAEGAGGALRASRLVNGGGMVHGGPDLLWRAQAQANRLVDEFRLQRQPLYARGAFLTWPAGSRGPRTPRTGGLWEDLDVFTIHGGLRSLSQALLQPFVEHVHFGHRLLHMYRADGVWQLRFNNRGAMLTLNAKVVILAVPPNVAGVVLDHGTVSTRFELSLLAEVRDASKRAFETKVVVVYEQPFWRTGGFSGSAVCPDGPLQIVYDGGIVHHDRFALVGLASQRIGRGTGRFHFERLALSQLAALFGEQATKPVNIFLLDWSSRPWKANLPAVEERRQRRRGRGIKECYRPQKGLDFILACSEMGPGEQAGNVEGALFAGVTAADFAKKVLEKNKRLFIS